MSFATLFKTILLGAADGGLDLAGNAAFPVAWPMIRKALEPAIERLKQKIGADPTASREATEKAVAAFERDADLQAMVEENLRNLVAPLLKTQQQLNEGQRRLLAIAQGQQSAMEELARRLDLDLKRIVDEGVAIKPEVQSTFADMIVARLKTHLGAEQARREKTHKVFAGQVARTQARAVELLNEGKPDRAVDELNAGLNLILNLLEERPDDVHLQVQLGYFFKTSAQAFRRHDVPEREAEYNDKALEMFRLVAYRTPLHLKTVKDQVEAFNGIGNIHYARGHHKAAIQNYRIATLFDPDYAFAWHDMCLAYHALAEQGEVYVDEMRHALDMARATGQGLPGLSQVDLDRFEQMYREFDPRNVLARLLTFSTEKDPELAELYRTAGSRKVESAASDPRLEQARALMAQGDLQNARTLLAGIVADHDPGDPVVWGELGSVLAHAQDYTGSARAYLRSAILSDAAGDLAAAAYALFYGVLAALHGKGVRLGSYTLNGLLRVFAGLKDWQGMIQIYRFKADEAARAGNLQEASRWVEQAVRCAGQSGDRKQEALYRWSHANGLAMLQQKDAALEELREARALYRQLAMTEELNRIDGDIRRLEASPR